MFKNIFLLLLGALMSLTLVTFTGCTEEPAPEAQQNPPAPKTGPRAAPPAAQTAPLPSGETELKILQFLPSGEAPVFNQIAVMFNQPMVALGDYDRTEEGILAIEPEIPGQIRWLNEYTLAFVPEKPLSGSLKLTATVKAGLKSLAGAVLKAGAQTQIILPGVEVKSVLENPPTGLEEGYKPHLVVFFNQPMDLASLNQKTAFAVKDLDDKTSRIGAVWEESTLYRYSDSRTWTAEVTADQILPLDREFELTASPGLISAAGPVPTPAELTIFKGSTPHLLEVKLNTTVCEKLGSTCDHNPNDALSLTFNNHVIFRDIVPFLEINPPYRDLDDLKKRLAAEKARKPSPAENAAGDTQDEEDAEIGDYLVQPRTYLNFFSSFKPLSDYTVTVKAGAADIYGQKIETDQVFTFRTGELTPMVRLAQTNGFLETGTDPVIPVSVVNTKSVEIKGYALTSEQAIKLIDAAEINYQSDYPRGLDEVRAFVQNLTPKNLTLYPPDGAKYGPVNMAVNLKELFGEQEMGHVLLITLIESDVVSEYCLIQVSDMGLTAKVGVTDGLIWVNDLKNGANMADVDLEIRGLTGQVYWQGKTDSLGLAKLPGRQEIFSRMSSAELDDLQKRNSWVPSLFITAKSQDQLTLWNLAWNNGFDYWRFNISYDNYSAPLSQSSYLAWLISAQPAYLPTEKIRLKCLVREVEGDVASLMPDQEVTIAVFNPRYEVVSKGQAKMTWGSAYYEFDLPKNPVLNDYTVILVLDPNLDLNGISYIYDSKPGQYILLGNFKVLNFRTPSFELTVDPVKNTPPGQKAEIKARAMYHFGTPLSGQEAIYSVSSDTAYDLSFPRLPGFSFINTFTDEDNDCYDCRRRYESVADGRIKSDLEGYLNFSFTVPAEKFPRPRNFSLYMTAIDADQRTVTNNSTFLVHPAELYAALKPKSSVVRAGGPAGIDLAVIDQKGEFKSGVSAQIKLFKRSWQTVRRRSVNGTYPYMSKKTDREISALEAKSGPEPVNLEINVPEPGFYWVLATVKDEAGQTNQATVSFYASGAGPVGWEYDSYEDSLTIIPDKDVYNPGDTARILVQSPFQDGLALVTTERAGIREVQSLPIDSQSPVFEIPLTEADRPNVYVSVILTRGRISEKPDDNNVDLGKPTIKKGYLTLKVAGNDDLLTVKVQPQKETYKPRDKVTVDLTVLEADGNPARGEVVVAVIDAGLVQVADDFGYYPEREFFKTRPLSVATVSTFDSIIGRRNLRYKASVPGGGGGLYQASPADTNLLRSNFLNLAYFEPFVLLDSQGKAQVTFELPDNLTTFKIYAVASGEGRKTGTGLGQILVTQNLLIRSALPKAAGLGDEFLASILLTNRGSDGQATVTVEAQNLDLLENPAPKTVPLKEGETKEVGYRVKANKTGPTLLTFVVSSGSDSDKAQFSLPVHYLSALSTQAAFRELVPGAAEVALSVGQNLDTSRGGLTIEVAPSLVTFLSAPWEYLKDYRYKCLEQTTSRAFGALALLRVKNWGLPQGQNEEELKQIISDQIQHISSQSKEGGYTLWPSLTGWNQRDLLLSAYILEFLTEARADGYEVPEKLIANTVVFVKSYVDNTEKDNPSFPGFPAWYTQETKRLINLYVVQALARAGQNVESHLENAYLIRTSQNLSELLYLTRAINSLPRSKTRVEQLKTLLGLIANQVTVGAGQNDMPGAWFDRGRLTALTLLVLAEAAPYNELIPGLIRQLSDVGRQGSFGSTQNNVTALLALTTYINKAESENIDITVEATGADREILKAAFTSFVDKEVIQNVASSDLSRTLDKIAFNTQGTGRAWAALRLKTAPIEPDLTAVTGNNISLSRSYTIVKPEPQEAGASSFKRGQVVKVTVTIMTPVERYNMVIEDPIPAGFEAVNFSLKDTDASLLPMLDAGHGDGSYRLFWYDHEEFWPDRVMATGSYLPPGVYTYSYLVRPATPGTYIVPGPQAEEIYSPENFGRGAGQKLTVE
ncbi:MAG: hypothetical protein LBP22_08510 [Deltaproteobacteria bacterium]|nr:hypothetical protein [Deltaproteobacteria bacterium]